MFHSQKKSSSLIYYQSFPHLALSFIIWCISQELSPETPCDQVLETEEWQALLMINKKANIMTVQKMTPPSIGDALTLIAKLGSHMSRKKRCRTSHLFDLAWFCKTISHGSLPQTSLIQFWNWLNDGFEDLDVCMLKNIKINYFINYL